MKRKIISLIIALCSSLMLLPNMALAADSDIVAIVYDNEKNVKGEFSDLQEAENSVIENPGYTVVLQKDVTITQISSFGEKEARIDSGLLMYNKKLDLNNRKLTINIDDTITDATFFSGICIMSPENFCEICNGIIEINCPNISPMFGAYGIGQFKQNITLNNIQITTLSNTKLKAAIGTGSDNTDPIILEDCIFDLPGVDLVHNINGDMSLPYKQATYIVSGYYNVNIAVDNHNIVQLSNPIELGEDIPGKVFVSTKDEIQIKYDWDSTITQTKKVPTTKAIVVDDGVAYTFSDAAKAQEKANTIANGFVYNLDSENKTLWVYDTDSGTYGENNDGMIRFLFKVLPQGDITETGIKFFSSDVTLPNDTNVKETLTGKANAFYGDIIGIPTGDSNTYYAAAYVKVGEETYWSDIQKCLLNPNRHFTNYSPANPVGGAE